MAAITTSRGRPSDAAIAAVRKFNRFYTKFVGAVSETWLGGAFSLLEVRILFEIANGESPTATDISTELDLKKSYLSQKLARFEKLGLIRKRPLKGDERLKEILLTRKGRSAFEKLDRMARDQVADIFREIRGKDRAKLLDSMTSIEAILENKEKANVQVVLRNPEPGDLGWVIQANGKLYAEEYGWDIRYEELVVQIVADLVKTFDPDRERCWIAEADGERVGCVLLVKENDDVARLRLLIVDANARGLGLGKRLVEECTSFARQAGYKKITLWTQSHLAAARGIYKRAGYVLVRSEPSDLFGHKMISETWDLEL